MGGTAALGTRFGRRTLVEVDGARWLMRCDCGAAAWCRRCDVRAGRCAGCLSCSKTQHGLARRGQVSRLYKIWRGIKHRCLNPRSNRWEHYGGRGITLHEEWASSFEVFAAAVGDPPNAQATLDRIDVNGDYAPGNVRWASPQEQAANKRKRGPEDEDDFAGSFADDFASGEAVWG